MTRSKRYWFWNPNPRIAMLSYRTERAKSWRGHWRSEDQRLLAGAESP